MAVVLVVYSNSLLACGLIVPGAYRLCPTMKLALSLGLTNM